MKRWIIVGMVVFVLGAVGFNIMLFTGPHMLVQPHLNAFEAVMPLPAEDSVPLHPPPALPSVEEARGLANPVEDTAENRARGKVYYQYYCLFCHGANGDGVGPVGESYVPLPADLRTAQTQSLTDGELYRSMLVGSGHQPVLERIIPPQHRWYLVRYLRELASSETARPRSPSTAPPFGVSSTPAETP